MEDRRMDANTQLDTLTQADKVVVANAGDLVPVNEEDTSNVKALHFLKLLSENEKCSTKRLDMAVELLNS
jgi:hypothetical protein